MKFDDFYGLPAQRDRLQSDARSGRWVHAYLFAGPDGTGKDAMASICARAVNCAGAQKPCDQCHSCTLYLHASHPDHIIVEPEKSIGVEAIRELNARLGSKPFEGGKYTVIIHQAHKMTVQAQNALLKTLEAPPGGVVFFLLTDSPSALLSTILSRVRTIRFSHIAQEDAVKALRDNGIEAERAELLAKVSLGSVGRALEINADDKYFAARDRVIKALNQLSSVASVGRAAMVLKDDDARDALSIMEDLALELLRAEENPDAANQTVLRRTSFDAGRFLIGIGEAKRRISSNVRWQSALEMLFLDIVGG